MSDVRELQVESADRLDRFLRSALPHVALRELRRLVATGAIELNGRRAKKGAPVRPGDAVCVPADLVETRELTPQPDLAIAILYEDAHMVAVDKPPGVPSVARHLRDTSTVANFLVGRFPETRTLERGELEAGLLHRLDSATSGALMAARSRPSQESLRRQFRARSVVKTYRAVVGGILDRASAVTGAIRTQPGNPARVEVVSSARPGSREAETRFRPLSSGASATLLEVEIRSGARHQIRAHLASIGHPIVGDPVYGGRNCERLLLHAHSLAFDHPESGRPIRIEAPVPEAFARLLQRDASAEL
jgi:23S rRNA pseudouridine1911/1915/1917 synthase